MSGALGAQMSAEAAALRYQIDPGPSRLTIKVTASGMLSAMGHNPTIAVGSFSGEATVTPGTLDGASLRVTAKPDSLEVTDDVSQKDQNEIETKMKQEVLETSRFPEITFESTGISATKMGDTQYAANLTGNLTLHGATKSQSVTCQVSLSGDTVRGYGEFTIKQTDFGIRLVSVAGGALKVKDEVKCTFDITMRNQA
jgi:polyisoprenoid-binding protein YceI